LPPVLVPWPPVPPELDAPLPLELVALLPVPPLPPVPSSSSSLQPPATASETTATRQSVFR
jgi:hypothetical protein